MRFLRWIGTVVEDKRGAISSKRVGMFICLWILSRAVRQPDINEVVIWAIVGLAFGFAGLTMPEWYSQLTDKNKEQ